MIIRAERKEKFTVVSNIALEDTRLSFRAKGILVFILSKPDRWQVSERHLAEQGPDGRSAVASALTELEEAGYLRRTRSRQPDGTFAWESMIFDEPQPANEPEPAEEAQPAPTAEVDHSDPPGSQRSTMAGKTGHGLTVRGKPSHIVNTEQVNTEQSKRDDDNEIRNRATPPSSSSSSAPPSADYQRIRATYEQNFGLLTPILSDRIKQAMTTYPAEWLLVAMERAVSAEKRRWDYVEGILRNWQVEGFQGKDRQRPPAAAQRPTHAAPATPGADPVWQQSWDEWIAELSRPAGLGD